MSRCALRPGALHLFASVLALGMTATLSAQWLKQPTRGIPRTPEGKADLSAPVPRMPDGTPDLSGLAMIWWTW